MNSLRLKYEGWLYWLAFLLALGFRFIQLGAAPLGDTEAALALQALHIAEGRDPVLSPQPGYILLTSVLFAVIESTNFMARFFPAIAGSVLVFVPLVFRDWLKARPALILAFLIAVDPGLVGLSRQAGGTMLAVAFLLLAWGMWINRRVIPAGIFAGLALLSGPPLWAGLAALGLTWIFLQGMQAKTTIEQQDDLEDVEPGAVAPPAPARSPEPNPRPAAVEVRPALISLAITVLLGGTLFLVSPNGLSAWLSALPAYLEGWTTPAALSPGRTLLVFIGYEPLGVFLAIMSVIRGYRTGSPRINALGLWLGASLLLAVFHRQPGSLVWAILPLLVLAALELSRSLHLYAEERLEVGVVTSALLILFVYMWFNLAKIALDPLGQLGITNVPLFGRQVQLQGAPYWVLGGAALIIVLCIGFVALGWSGRTARLGAVWSFSMALGVYSLAAAWGASDLRLPNGLELWSTDAEPDQADLLLRTVDDISEFSMGHDRAQAITVMGIDSPALEWVLRNHDAEIVSALDPQFAPPLVLTPVMESLDLPSAYRGQDFTWRQYVLWDGIRNPDWVRWVVYRELPRQNETIILWARDDLFPDARESSQQP